MTRSMRVAIAESVPFSDALLGLQQLDEAFPEIAGHLDAACQLPLALQRAGGMRRVPCRRRSNEWG